MNAIDKTDEIPEIIIEKYEAFIKELENLGLGIEMIGVIINGLPMKNREKNGMPLPIQYQHNPNYEPRLTDSDASSIETQVEIKNENTGQVVEKVIPQGNFVPSMLTIYPKKDTKP